MGRFRLFAVVACVCVGVFYVVVAGLLGVEDFAAGFGEAFFGAAVLSEVPACLSGVAEGEDCGSACAAEWALFNSAHSALNASTHHHLRPNRTTLVFFAKTRRPEPVQRRAHLRAKALIQREH